MQTNQTHKVEGLNADKRILAFISLGLLFAALLVPFIIAALGRAVEALKQAVLDTLGLELVPSREPVEMLVVEKAK